MIKKPTLAETFAFIDSYDEDIADNIFDFYSNLGFSREKSSTPDPYNDWVKYVAKHLLVKQVISPRGGHVGYIICYISEFIVKYQKAFDKFMEQHNRMGYRPSDYDEKLTPDDEEFYDLYLTTFECLLIGNYAESDYRTLLNYMRKEVKRK